MAADPQDMEIELEEENPDSVENDDGSVDFLAPENDDNFETAGEGGFYDNLVFDIPDKVLDDIATDLLEKIKNDKESRSRRDELYAEGIRRTGLGNDAPGGAQFEGASRVVHPMLTTAAIEFEARAIKELMPPGGPVKSHIPGEMTKKRWNKAERLRRFFNWQLTVQMQEFRPELEKILVQESLGGVQYQRLTWDRRLRRPATMSVPVDRIILPFAAASFYTAERIALIDDITDLEFKQRIRDGIYVANEMAEIMPPSMAPERTKPQEARNKVEGKEPDVYNQDGVRRTYEVNVLLEGLNRYVGGGPVAPFIVFLDESTRKVLGIQRNWEEEDTNQERMHWIIEWPFAPWEGALPIGLVHMIGSLAASATGALRALLDAAHVNNVPTSARLKGAQVGGQSKTPQVGESVEIDGGVGADDIRKLIMPLVFNQPSTVLYQLLQFVVESGSNVVRTAFEKLADNNPNMPVGTTMAVIEQGLVVVSAIIGRQHYSMGMVLKVLFRLNRMYLTDEELRDEAGELLAYRKDFQGPMDVVPVSDPSIPTDAHRFAQMQAVMQRADAKPMLYDQRAVEVMFLERMRIPNADSLLVPAPVPQEMNAANENAAVALGRPIAAFPEQDHLAHIQVHVDFMESPFFGQLITIAPKFLPGILEHLNEHITLWYVNRMYEHLSSMMQVPITEYMKIKNPLVKREIDRNIATVSQDIMKEASKAFQKLPPIIQRAQQLMQQLAPQMPQDPNAQVQMQRNQIQAKKNDDDTNLRKEELRARAEERNMRVVEGTRQAQIDVAKQQNESRRAQMQEEGEDRRTGLKEMGNLQRMQVQQEAENARTAAKIESAEAINEEDNTTALTIAQAEIESGERVAKSSGKDSSPGS